ncbi:MAG: hypothetical protein K5796_00540 [Lachnospiraceae bacterium]|nr:hypothetical protein [Lachnospiraceae bacterium]
MSNREFKSDVFCMLLQEPENALQIYNGLNNSHYTDATLVKSQVLDKGISLSVRNDAAFIVGSDLSLYEHQATYNPNMPLRHLIYFSHIIDNMIRKEDLDLYASKRISIPVPQFVVFYNGIDKRPSVEIQRLSDNFQKKTEEPNIELVCTVYNINPGYNSELVDKCPVIKDYTEFVERVRTLYCGNKELEEAIDSSIDSCMKDGILEDFFRRRRNEVTKETMIDMRWEVRERLIRRDEHNDGVYEGRFLHLIELVIRKIQKGKSVSEIVDDLDEDEDLISRIYEIALRHAPDYDASEIYKELPESKATETY